MIFEKAKQYLCPPQTTFLYSQKCLYFLGLKETKSEINFEKKWNKDLVNLTFDFVKLTLRTTMMGLLFYNCINLSNKGGVSFIQKELSQKIYPQISDVKIIQKSYNTRL